MAHPISGSRSPVPGLPPERRLCDRYQRGVLHGQVSRVADELGALQTAPGYDDMTGLGTPTSSSLAALSGK